MYAPALPDQDRSLLRRLRRQQEQGSRTRRAAPGGDIALLRHLQRSAGNAAVSRLLRSHAGARSFGGAPVQRCGATPCDCPADEQVAHALRDSLGDVPDLASSRSGAPLQRLPGAWLQREADNEDDEQTSAPQPAVPETQADAPESTGSDPATANATEGEATASGDAGSATQDNGSGTAQTADSGQSSDTATDSGADSGAQVAPMGEITGEGRPKDVEVFGGVSLQGRTNASFRSSFSTSGAQTTAGSDCSGCSGNDCVHVTGTLTSTFSMTTSVTLPPVPSGLSACATRRVRYAIQHCLAPHEQQHVAAFNTYRGTSSQPYDLTTCRSSLNSQLQALHDAVDGPRQAAAQAASDALDPYQVDIDLDCEDGETDSSTGVTCP